MKTVVLANQKGGVGKSAIATQLAHHLHRQGRPVVVIDLDHQQNTSRPLLLNAAVTPAPFTASTIFTSTTAPPLPSARFVVVPGDDKLSALERQPAEHNAYATRMRAALQAWDAFDVAILDTNPNPDIRYASALIAADVVLAPIQLNQEAIEGVASLLHHPRYGIIRIQAALNPSLRLMGILPNLVEPTPFQRGNLQELVARHGGRLLARRNGDGTTYGFIPKRSIIAEAQAVGAFVADLSKTSARDTWREVQSVFDMIVDGLALAPAEEVVA
jgi:chromosome partitioning protein